MKTKVFHTHGNRAWVPKVKLQSSSTNQSLQPRQAKQVWQQKTSVKSTSTHVYYQQYTPQIEQVWKRKDSMQMPGKEKEFPKESHMVWQPIANATSKSSQQVHPTKRSNDEDVQRTEKRICFRALYLQLKLFGFSSVLLPSKNWLEMVRTQ